MLRPHERYYTLIQHEYNLIKHDDEDIRRLGKKAVQSKALALCFRDRKDIVVLAPIEEGGEKIAQASFDSIRGTANFGWF